jgi:hypothetical protein
MGQVYEVFSEFLSGNGTYDLRMLMLIGYDGEVFVVPELDVKECSPEVSPGN